MSRSPSLCQVPVESIADMCFVRPVGVYCNRIPLLTFTPKSPEVSFLDSVGSDCMLYLYLCIYIHIYVYIHSVYNRYLWSNHCRCLHITCSHHSARLKRPSKRYLARCTSLCPQVRASLMIMSGFDLPPQKGGAPVALSKRLGEIYGKWETHAKGTWSLRCTCFGEKANDCQRSQNSGFELRYFAVFI